MPEEIADLRRSRGVPVRGCRIRGKPGFRDLRQITDRRGRAYLRCLRLRVDVLAHRSYRVGPERWRTESPTGAPPWSGAGFHMGMPQ